MRVVVKRAFTNEPTTLTAFADKYHLVLELTERPAWTGKAPWEACFQNIAVVKNGAPDMMRGWGDSPESAVENYCGIIADKHLMLRDGGLFGNEREVHCPESWTDTSFPLS